MARAKNCTLRNAWVSGFAFISSVVIGTASPPPEATNNTLENINVHSPAVSPDTAASTRADGLQPENAIQLRDGHRDNILRDISLEYASGETGQRIELQSPSKLVDFSYHGPANRNNLIYLWSSNQKIIRPDMTITSDDGTLSNIINPRDDADNIFIDRPDISESTTSSPNGVVYFQPPSAVTNLEVRSPLFDIGGSPIWVDGGSNGVQINLSGDIDPSLVTQFGTVAFAGDVMIPQDVTAIPSGWLYDRRLNFNDGTTGTEGPAYYDSANTQWVSVVDGTTFS